MRIVISDFISLDGVVQAPGGPDEDTDNGFTHGGWSMVYFDPDTMGPVLDEVMAAAWPGRAGDPSADRMNAIRKYVASRTLSQDDLHWPNAILLPADNVVGAVQQVRAQDGGDIQVMGSASLARTLISHDRVDEYRLMIEPILLGGSKRPSPTTGAPARSSWPRLRRARPASTSAPTTRMATPRSESHPLTPAAQVVRPPLRHGSRGLPMPRPGTEPSAF